MEVRIKDNAITIEGYVNSVERDSKVLRSKDGEFVEQVVTGTWTKALEANKDVKLLFNHNESRDLGSNFELTEDTIGLKIRANITDEEVVKKGKKGLLTGFSFGFLPIKQRYEEAKEGLKRRFLEEIKLFEVSILDCTPAYNGTLCEVRSEEETVELRFTQTEDLKIVDLDKEAEEKRLLDESNNRLEIIKAKTKILKLKQLTR